MGLETSTYIDGLVTTNPVGSSDTKAQGDDHIRLLKSTIKNTFPNLTGAVSADQTELNYLDGATGVTGTGNTVRSASPTLTGTATAATINATTVAATNVSGTLSGNGASITALNATQLTSGSVPDARVPSSNVTQHNASITARNISGKTGITKTLSTSAPSGGADGDIWYRY